MSSQASPQAGTVRANLVALGVAEAVARVAQLLTIALLGRVLGPAGLGVVGVAWAAFQLAIPFVQYAPELMGTRDIAQGAETGDAFIDVTAIKLVIGIVAAAAMAVGGTLVFVDDPVERLQIVVQAASPIAVALNGVWAFRGLRRFAAYAIVRCVQSVVLLGCLAALLNPLPVPWIVPATEAGVGLLTSGLAFALLFDWRSTARVTMKICRRGLQLRARIGEAIHFGLGSFFVGAIWTVPLLVGRVLLQPADQGYLAAALRLFVALSALYQLVLQVFHPVLAHRYAVDRPAGASLSASLVVYAAAASVPVAAILVACAPWIVGPLLGAAFVPMTSAFVMLALVLVPTVVGSVFGYALLADGRYGLYVWICAGGAVAALAGCTVAFHVWPHADAIGVLIVVACLVALASGIAAWRLGLVRFADVHLGQLAPARIQKVLMER